MFRDPIYAVTVCVNYGDFLQAIAPHNSPLFDKWVIVTTPDDDETRAVCHKFGFTCVLSEEHRKTGGSVGKFNKGAMVDRGLQMCPRDSWRLHLDSDIVLPAQFRHLLEIADPRPGNLYGIDRVNVQGWDQWQALLKSGFMHHAADMHHLNCIELPKGIPVGARWASWRTGWVPLGFFQMWHSVDDEKGWAMTKHYPKNSGDACHSDTQHAFQWDRKNRVFIPEVVGVHLDSEPSHTGANWNGRKTKRFGPPSATPAETAQIKYPS